MSTPTLTRPAVELHDLTKRHGTGPNSTLALDRLDLTVNPGEFVCLVGASGCGKSTLLSLLAGLTQPTAGELNLSTERTALMFQDATLMPWLTVGENVDLALRLRGVPRGERPDQVADLLGLVHLAGLQKKRPHELSGGMRQRVSLARMLAQQADLVLMDEPFGALDAMTRDAMHDELERIWAEHDLTVLFVTHNVREAVRLGQRVLLMSSRPGRIVHEWPVQVTGPRRIGAPEVAALADEITARLREEISRHAR